MTQQWTIPGGKMPPEGDKGQPLEAARDGSLSYWAERLEKGVAEGSARNAARDGALAAAMRAEIARRAGGGTVREQPALAPRAAPPAPSTALARADSASLARPGSYSDGDRLTAALAEASASYNLVSPATSCASLPEGCEVTMSLVQVDVSEGKTSEVYDVGGGKFTLLKSALDRISRAAQVSWDEDKCGRLDNGAHPHYCAWRATARVRRFDGSEEVLVRHKELDLRDGSDEIKGMREAYKVALDRWERQGRRGAPGLQYEPKDPEKQIREMRKFIMAHAESKAMNRVIRSLGLKSGYTREELAKPFLVAGLQFTGRTNDPQLKREFATMRAAAMLGGSRALYGQQNQGAPAMRAPAPAQLFSPPQLGDNSFDDEPTPVPYAAIPQQAQAHPMMVDAKVDPAPAAVAAPRLAQPAPARQSPIPPPSSDAGPPADAGDAWEPGDEVPT